MRVLQVNIFGNLSTGRIAVDLYRTLKEAGYESVVAFARNTIAKDVPYIKIGNTFNVCIDGIMTRLTDKAGFYSKFATRKFIKEIEDYNPDVIHLHNLHGYYINIEILFNYLKSCGKPVIWTLHDCWAFTGHCCYYTMAKCYKWKTQCYNCKQKMTYPASYADNSKWNYNTKKRLFLSVPNMTLVAVSQWLAREVKQSFLKDVPLEVIYNGIDTDIFKPTKSNFRQNYNLENKFIILGVASTWGKRKGLADFIRLSKIIDKHCKIVLIGITKKEMTQLPKNILGISRTDSVEELAGIYTTADIFFNASVEETFGLTTVEAMACETPVIVYNSTSLPEVCGSDIGWIVEPHAINDVLKIIRVIRDKSIEKGVYRKSAMKYSKKLQFNKYIDLYEKILGGGEYNLNYIHNFYLIYLNDNTKQVKACG